MIQSILTFCIVGLATFYVGKKLYTQWFSTDDNCKGCAVQKIHESK